MKNEAPEKIYLVIDPVWGSMSVNYNRNDTNNIEYTRTDVVVEKVINFLNYKLDDVVAIRVGGTIIPRNVAKQEVIEDFRKYMKGE